MHFIRFWQPADVEGIKQHLLIVGDVTGECGACRCLGIKYTEVKGCPECKTEFKFMTARAATGSAKAVGGLIKRLKDRRPDLQMVDFDDYKAVTGRLSARDLLG